MTTSSTNLPIVDVQQTDCCIVGGGPAGVMLAYLLAKQGIQTTLLEAHRDFNRDFRGDTIQPSTMEIMEDLGLADRLLHYPHTKTRQISLRATQGHAFAFDFSHLKVRHPYVVIMPQVKFLEFMVAECQKFQNFHLGLGVNVQDLVIDGEHIQGVRYRSQDGWHEVRAQVVIAADGRHSRLRELAGLSAIATSAPMDVLWFRLPRLSDDGEGLNGRIANGHMVAMLDRGDEWQIAYVIPKGEYQQIRAAGLDALHQSIVEVLPEFQARVKALQDWHQIAYLPVESSFVKQWYRPGLLLIGDAAHVMSPVGGVGINYAIQDAVAAANCLSAPLKQQQVQLQDLARVQRRRALPTRIIQTFQSLVQSTIVKSALNPNQTFEPPLILQLPGVRSLPARLIAIGLFPEHVSSALK